MGERTLAQKMASVRDLMDNATERNHHYWYMLHETGGNEHDPCTLDKCGWGEENNRWPCPIVVYGQILDDAIERGPYAS